MSYGAFNNEELAACLRYLAGNFEKGDNTYDLLIAASYRLRILEKSNNTYEVVVEWKDDVSNKIQTIKAVRALTNKSLKESKELVEKGSALLYEGEYFDCMSYVTKIPNLPPTIKLRERKINQRISAIGL